MDEWKNRRLEEVYPFVYIDAIHFNVKENWNYTQPEWGETLKELEIIIPITPMIIGHEMFAIFDEYSDKEIWKKADNII